MARDANDIRQNRRLEAIQKRYDHEDDEALRVLLGTPNGRQVLTRLARNCAWMGEGWDPSSTRLTDFNAGRRSVALGFMGDAERVAPDDFHLMLREAADRDKAMTLVKDAATTDEKEQDNG